MSKLLKDCDNLINLNLSNFITTNVKDMSYMFIDCLSLKDINVQRFDTKNEE